MVNTSSTDGASGESIGSKESEEVDSDEDSSIWSEESPPDNSPLVKPAFSVNHQIHVKSLLHGVSILFFLSISCTPYPSHQSEYYSN